MKKRNLLSLSVSPSILECRQRYFSRRMTLYICMYHCTKMADNYTKDNTSADCTVVEHLLLLEVHTNIPTAV